MTAASMHHVVAANLDRIRERIAAAARRSGRDPSVLSLMAVTKSQDPAVLEILNGLGVHNFGENRVDHLATMHAAAPAGARFHYIGRVQSRQFKDLVPLVASLHSLADPGHLSKLARACRAAGRRLPVFLQVNTAGEAQKAGLDPGQIEEVLGRATTEDDALEVVGLMTLAPDTERTSADTDDVRRCFADLRSLADRHHLARCSMGMSQDFEIAIEEGATDLRLGSILFATDDGP